MPPDTHRRITLTVNGERVTADVPVRQHLADFLRQSVGLTGTHLGCEHGSCGACTVLVDGQLARGCLMLAAQADGAVFAQYGDTVVLVTAVSLKTAREGLEELEKLTGLDADAVVVEYGGNDCSPDWKAVSEDPETLHPPRTTLADFEVQVLDGEEWRTAGKVQGNAEQRVEVVFEHPVATSAMRGYITGLVEGENQSRISEVEAYAE